MSLLRTERSDDGDLAGLGIVGAIQGMLDIERQRCARCARPVSIEADGRRRESLIQAIYNVDRSKKRARADITRKVEKFQLEAQLAEDAYGRHVTPSVSEAHDSAKGVKPVVACLPWRDAADDLACQVAPAPTPALREVLADDYLRQLVRITENVQVLLPSMYHSRIRGHPAMKKAVDYERKLREGQANDALDTLRTHIAARYSLRDLRNAVKGPKHGKEVKSLADGQTKIGEAAKYEYRRLRVVLRLLGMPEDHPTYRPLEDADLNHFAIMSEQSTLGKNSKPESWLWSNFGFINKQDNQEVKSFFIQSA